MAPITGPAASLGQPQVHWANFYKISTTVRTRRSSSSSTRTPARRRERNGRGGQGRTVARLQLQRPRRRRPSRHQRGEGDDRRPEGRRPRLRLRLGDEHAITTDGARTDYFFRTVPPDSSQSKTVSGYIVKKLKLKRVYIVDDQEAYSIGLADRSREAEGKGRQRFPRRRQPAAVGLLGDDHEDPAQHAARVHPVAAAAQGQGLRPADEEPGPGQHQADGIRRSLRSAVREPRVDVYDSFFPVNPADAG